MGAEELRREFQARIAIKSWHGLVKGTISLGGCRGHTPTKAGKMGIDPVI